MQPFWIYFTMETCHVIGMKFHTISNVSCLEYGYNGNLLTLHFCDTIVTKVTKYLGHHSVSPNALLITCTSFDVILLIICLIVPTHARIANVSFPLASKLWAIFKYVMLSDITRNNCYSWY